MPSEDHPKFGDLSNSIRNSPNRQARRSNNTFNSGNLPCNHHTLSSQPIYKAIMTHEKTKVNPNQRESERLKHRFCRCITAAIRLFLVFIPFHNERSTHKPIITISPKKNSQFKVPDRDLAPPLCPIMSLRIIVPKISVAIRKQLPLYRINITKRGANLPPTLHHFFAT